MSDKHRIQKRRTISFPPEAYELIAELAAKETKSLAHYVIDKLRAAGVPLPETSHMEYAATRKAIETRAKNQARADEPSDTAPR